MWVLLRHSTALLNVPDKGVSMKHLTVCALCACVVATAASAKATYNGDPSSLFLHYAVQEKTNELVNKYPYPIEGDNSNGEYEWGTPNIESVPDKEKKFERPRNNCFPPIIETHGGSDERPSA